MKASSLHELWTSPDNSRVTSKQYSFRFPVHVAAKIEALCEMYPTKTRTQIVGDLLTAALEDVQRSFQFIPGPFAFEDDKGQKFYEDVGVGARFNKLVDKHYMQIEKEMGNPDPKPFFGGPFVDVKD